MKIDRFLLAILIGIGVLIVAALAVFFTRQNAQDYLPEESPTGVVHNYVLALQRGSYERAFGYLEPREDGLDLETFRQFFLMESPHTLPAVEISGYNAVGDEAVVELVLIYSQSGPFNDPYRESTRALLVQTPEGSWQIREMPVPFMTSFWFEETAVPKP